MAAALLVATVVIQVAMIVQNLRLALLAEMDVALHVVTTPLLQDVRIVPYNVVVNVLINVAVSVAVNVAVNAQRYVIIIVTTNVLVNVD